MACGDRTTQFSSAVIEERVRNMLKTRHNVATMTLGLAVELGREFANRTLFLQSDPEAGLSAR